MYEGLYDAKEPEYASLARRIDLRLKTRSGRWKFLGSRTTYGSIRLKPLALRKYLIGH
jgi:hypothetical protein